MGRKGTPIACKVRSKNWFIVVDTEIQRGRQQQGTFFLHLWQEQAVEGRMLSNKRWAGCQSFHRESQAVATVAT